jgi:hypothetical protein
MPLKNNWHNQIWIRINERTYIQSFVWCPLSTLVPKISLGLIKRGAGELFWNLEGEKKEVYVVFLLLKKVHEGKISSNRRRVIHYM